MYDLFWEDSIFLYGAYVSEIFSYHWKVYQAFWAINFSKLCHLLRIGTRDWIQYARYISRSSAILEKSQALGVIKNERQNFPACLRFVFRSPRSHKNKVRKNRAVHNLCALHMIKRSISESLWAAFIARELHTQMASIQGILEK